MLESPDFANADITSTANIVDRKSVGAIGLVKFLGALACRPLRAKRRNQPIDLVEIHAVTTKIWSAAGSVFYAALWNHFSNNFCKLVDTKVLFIAAHVEDLIVNGFTRCFENSNHRTDNVADVNDRPPGSAVALDHNSACGQ